jgi:hypothetical protein
MALGAGAVSKNFAAGTPRFHEHITVVGDGAYPAGGTPGFKAYFEDLVGAQREILAVVDQSDPSTVSRLEYDHTNDKLFARVRATGAESAVANQSGVTYRLLVLSK